VQQQLGMGATAGEDLDPKILVPGFTEMIERLALHSGADIRLSHRIVSVDRSKVGCAGGSGEYVSHGRWMADKNSCGYSVLTSDFGKTFKCSHVVMNVPVPRMLRDNILDIEKEEMQVLNKIGSCNEWQTFLFRGAALGSLDAVDTWPLNFGGTGKLVTSRMTPRIIGGWRQGDTVAPEEFVTLSLQSQRLTTAEVEANVITELERSGATNISTLDSFRAEDYNCMFSHKAVQDGLPWEMDNMQGKRQTFFVGGSVSFEAMEHILSHVQTTALPMLAQMVACGWDQCCRCRAECEGRAESSAEVRNCYSRCLPPATLSNSCGSDDATQTRSDGPVSGGYFMRGSRALGALIGAVAMVV
jgi:hypothetical protein